MLQREDNFAQRFVVAGREAISTHQQNLLDQLGAIAMDEISAEKLVLCASHEHVIWSFPEYVKNCDLQPTEHHHLISHAVFPNLEFPKIFIEVPNSLPKRIIIPFCITIALMIVLGFLLLIVIATRTGKDLYNSILNFHDDKRPIKIQELHSIRSELLRLREEEKQLAANAAIGKIAEQIAHDIRSPLTALKVVSGHIAELPEEKRVMIRNAVQRIDDIANDLAGKKTAAHVQQDSSSPTHESLAVQLLSSLIEPLISEKRIQLRARFGIQIQCVLNATSYGLFAHIQPVEFKRLLSNLINNAVEAMKNDGEVAVTLTQIDNTVCIAVADTGAGIPPEILPKLMQRGATFGKAQGSGLGLFHARTTVESWGGALELQSTVGVGTTAIVTLPRAGAPAWFVPELACSPQQTIVIVDDDTSIHQVWDERFASPELESLMLHMQHFSSGTEMIRWYREHSPMHMLVLCDYELLGESKSGLDVIEELKMHERAILVTSRYEDPLMQERCAKLGVRLIPKGLAGYVPIQIHATSAWSMTAPKNADVSTADETAPPTAHQTQQLPNVLVIDDDSGIRSVWKLVGRGMGIGTLIAFDSLESCEAAAPDYSQFTLAFVDKHIDKSQWRVDEVVQRLKAHGVPHVIVASGESYDALSRDPLCTGADGIAAPKIPESLAPFLEAAAVSQRHTGGIA